MRIGLVSQALPYLPSRGGFRLYGGNLIRHLAREHEVDLVSLLVDDDEKHLDWARQACRSVTTIPVTRSSPVTSSLSALSAYAFGRPLRQRDAMRRTLAPLFEKWDVIHVEGAYAGGILPDLPIAKVLSLHDSWTLRCAEMLKCNLTPRERLHYRLLSWYEPRYERLVYPRFERCTVVAEPDIQEVRRVVPECRVDLIPYGTDTEYFHPVPARKEAHSLVFHSHLGYAPNVAAAVELVEEILPLVQREIPEASLHLVGASPAPEVAQLAARPGVRISANLPDLRETVCSGQIYACAIRYGTGLKSKMLEAMGMQLPIVGYPGAIVGLEGSQAGQHYLVADDPRGFADHVVTLLRDPERAQRMARAGRELVERAYSWESRARAYVDLYRRVVEERRQARH